MILVRTANINTLFKSSFIQCNNYVCTSEIHLPIQSCKTAATTIMIAAKHHQNKTTPNKIKLPHTPLRTRLGSRKMAKIKKQNKTKQNKNRPKNKNRTNIDDARSL